MIEVAILTPAAALPGSQCQLSLHPSGVGKSSTSLPSGVNLKLSLHPSGVGKSSTGLPSGVNLFASRPVAATGFQTTAAYYTLRGDALHGSHMNAAV